MFILGLTVEIAIIVLLILLFLAIAFAVLLLTGVLSSTPVATWTTRRPARAEHPVRTARVIDLEPEPEPVPASSRELTPDPTARIEALVIELQRYQAAGDDRLVTLSRQLNELRDDLATELPTRLGDIQSQAAARWSDLQSRQATVEAQQLAAAERLQSELARQRADQEHALAELARSRADQERAWGEFSRQANALGSPGQARLLASRAEAAAELYALAARLETAVCAVTNPVLLPGEPYAPPAELPREALSWDNWKDVGERTFGFAAAFSAKRVLLSTATSDELAASIVELRETLTGQIYPPLRARANPASTAALLQALNTLATLFQRLRAILDQEVRVASGQILPDATAPAPGAHSEI